MKLFLEILQGFLDRGLSRCKATTSAGQHNTEKCGHTSMPRVGFEPTIPVFERLKTVRALDCAANWIGSDDCEIIKF
jgi:hypothetical protein